MATTELEGVILGIVSSRQPCSAYVIRQRFEQSPTWGWSSSKGAIYPAVRRLVDAGFLKSTEVRLGRKTSSTLTLTRKGATELRRWIVDLAPEMGGAPIDPVRTRVNYIANLAPEERRAFLSRALDGARAALAKARDSFADPSADDQWALELSRAGVIAQLHAKIRWLEEAFATLGESEGP